MSHVLPHPAEANLKHNGKSWQLAAGVTQQWVGFERTVSQQEEPIVLKAKARRVPQWKMQRGKNPASGRMVAAMAEPPPDSPVTTEGPEVDVELVPFGCTRLRVAEFPTVAMPRASRAKGPGASKGGRNRFHTLRDTTAVPNAVAR